MLPKKNRLTRKGDFTKVLKEGKTFRERLLILKIIKNNTETTRAGFIVSLRVSKKAVLRNKVKRILRSLVGVKLKEIKRGTDMVLIALPGLGKEPFPQLADSVNKVFLKAGLGT